MKCLDSNNYEFSDEDYNERYGRYGDLLDMEYGKLRDEALKYRNTCVILDEELCDVSSQLDDVLFDSVEQNEELKEAYEIIKDLRDKNRLWKKNYKWFFWTWLVTASVMLFTPDVVNLINSHTAK